MEAFNGEPNVREQRLAAYEDRYITVTPSESMRGLRLEHGGEIHRDDGSITSCGPGDWVIELPDGSLGRVAAQTFVHSFKAEGKDAQLFAARQQVGLEKAAELPAPEVPPSPESIKEAVLAAHEETNKRVRDWADAAFEGELISSDEHRQMVANNELPDGLTVQESSEGWVLSREGGKDVGSLAGDVAQEEKVDLRDLTANELRAMLDDRGIAHRRTDKKGDLIQALEDYVPAQVLVGAEVPETAAREPQAPQWGAEAPTDTEADLRRPGGETRTAEDGEVTGAQEEQHAKDEFDPADDPDVVNPDEAPEPHGTPLEDTPQVNPNPAADES
jgi:hypothetical protein